MGSWGHQITEVGKTAWWLMHVWTKILFSHKNLIKCERQLCAYACKSNSGRRKGRCSFLSGRAPPIFRLLLTFSETWVDKITRATLLQMGIRSTLDDSVLQGCQVVAVWKDSSKDLKKILNVSLKHLEEYSLERETFRKGPEIAVGKSPFQLHEIWQVWAQLHSYNFHCQR